MALDLWHKCFFFNVESTSQVIGKILSQLRKKLPRVYLREKSWIKRCIQWRKFLTNHSAFGKRFFQVDWKTSDYLRYINMPITGVFFTSNLSSYRTHWGLKDWIWNLLYSFEELTEKNKNILHFFIHLEWGISQLMCLTNTYQNFIDYQKKLHGFSCR